MAEFVEITGSNTQPEATPSSRPTGVAPDPFDRPSADTILRSSDGIGFYVQKDILIESSAFFETMFSLPQPADSDPSQTEPIPVAETSPVLIILLRLVYPLVDRVPNDLTLEDTRAVLEAAQKYDMPTPIELMRRSLLGFVQTQPLRVYAISCLLKLEREARIAAERVIQIFNLEVDYDLVAQELGELPAGCYHRLLRFHATASNRLGNFDFIRPVSGTQYPDRLVDIASEPLSRQWRDAGPPFDRSDADTIVASQDQVRFRIHSAILKIVSPVWGDMLMSRQPYPNRIFEEDAELQNVPIYLVLSDCSSEVLEVLFRLSFPMNTLDISEAVGGYSYMQLRAVTEAARKYSMDGITRLLKVHHLTRLEPLRAWLSTIVYGWTDQIEAAAARTLELDASKLRAIYEPDLERIPSSVYIRLLHYHRRCSQAASTAASTAADFPDHLLPTYIRVLPVARKSAQRLTHSGKNSSKIEQPIRFNWKSYAETISTLLRTRPYARGIYGIQTGEDFITDRGDSHSASPSQFLADVSQFLTQVESMKASVTAQISDTISKVQY